jgi:hypothetical protein
MRHQAIQNVYPNVSTINGESEAWDIDGNVVELDENKVETEVKRLQADYDAKQYQRDRQYPLIGEQLDLQYWDKKNGTKKWEEAIDKVKADHPKG